MWKTKVSRGGTLVARWISKVGSGIRSLRFRCAKTHTGQGVRRAGGDRRTCPESILISDKCVNCFLSFHFIQLYWISQNTDPRPSGMPGEREVRRAYRPVPTRRHSYDIPLRNHAWTRPRRLSCHINSNSGSDKDGLDSWN